MSQPNYEQFPHLLVEVCEKCHKGKPAYILGSCNHVVCKTCYATEDACCGQRFTLEDVKTSKWPLSHYIVAAASRPDEPILDYILQKTGDRSLFKKPTANRSPAYEAWFQKNINRSEAHGWVCPGCGPCETCHLPKQ